MSNLLFDILICLFLLAGAGFGLISLMGLLIFPDIHSRMYTALRAGLICMGAVVGAAVLYAFWHLTDNGGDLYFTFFFHTLFLASVIAVGVMVINRQVLDKTQAMIYCGTTPVIPADKKKDDS